MSENFEIRTDKSFNWLPDLAPRTGSCTCARTLPVPPRFVHLLGGRRHLDRRRRRRRRLHRHTEKIFGTFRPKKKTNLPQNETSFFSTREEPGSFIEFGN